MSSSFSHSATGYNNGRRVVRETLEQVPLSRGGVGVCMGGTMKGEGRIWGCFGHFVKAVLRSVAREINPFPTSVSLLFTFQIEPLLEASVQHAAEL